MVDNTPWIIDDGYIFDADHNIIGKTYQMIHAAHIVKCVNMHDELVEALKKAHMAIAASLLIACGIYPTQHNIDQTIDESETGTIIGDIRETLAKARGE